MCELRLRSKALKYIDYKDVDIKELFPEFIFNAQKFRTDIKRIQFSYGKKESADIVEENDILICDITSNDHSYEKNDLNILVGKGLFDESFEKSVIGAKKGEGTYEVNGITLNVTIKDIVRTVVPELTDENVSKWNIEGVNTVEDLNHYVFDRQVDDFRDDSEDADMASTFSYQKIVEGIDFSIDEEEISYSIRSMERQMANFSNDIPNEDEPVPEEFTDLEGLKIMMATQTVQSAALGCELFYRNGEKLTEEDYKAAFEKRKLILKKSDEETRQIYSEIDFMLEYFSEYYFTMIDRYVGSEMKKYYYKQTDLTGIFDVIIIGAGPGGLSSALTLNVHNKSIKWFGSTSLSDKVERSEKIINYAGFSEVTGSELNQKFSEQIKANGLKIVDKKVSNVIESKGIFMVQADNDIYYARTIVLAIGSVPAKGIENEHELLGHGVSYCATCDGFLYEGKEICIYCQNEKYEHEVSYLAEIASKVYLYTPYESQIELENVIKLNSPMRKVLGDQRVEGIELSDKTQIFCSGIFFLRDSVAPSTMIKGLELDGAHIVVNRNCETNIPGIYACGDCTGRPYQIAKAVGEGNVCAHSIVEYLSRE